MFQNAEAERRRDHRTMENFYYECRYDILVLREADINGGNIHALNNIKAEIVEHKAAIIIS